jgi:hypothetical protein
VEQMPSQIGLDVVERRAGDEAADQTPRTGRRGPVARPRRVEKRGPL